MIRVYAERYSQQIMFPMFQRFLDSQEFLLTGRVMRFSVSVILRLK
jgi:hypothetical protein